ncbi:hypothetical protein [Ornithinimicrobium kibberense]|uniref:hypothetical protein n=1 Tax=Ornithinimicrobium kibberense TaxID=282060 RepID=UPI00361BB39D
MTACATPSTPVRTGPPTDDDHDRELRRPGVHRFGDPRRGRGGRADLRRRRRPLQDRVRQRPRRQGRGPAGAPGRGRRARG